MSMKSFDKLLVLVGPRITYENTQLQLSVPPQERFLPLKTLSYVIKIFLRFVFKLWLQV
jgi:hypothetical protein